MAEIIPPKKDSNTKRSTFSKEKILLALIPVLGSIIIAYIEFSKNTPDITIDAEKVAPTSLKSRAGKINELIVYRRYDDIVPLMNVGVKPVLTREVFNRAMDSTTNSLGQFIKPIDTTFSEISGNKMFYIRNQYEKGETVNQIIFDNQGAIFGLFTIKKP